jgi:histidinol dehydrogenase
MAAPAPKHMLRVTTLGELDAAALTRLAPTIDALAEYEGLPCHRAAEAVRIG